MTFDHYLQKSEEIGVVKSTDFPLVYVMGLPGARIDELVVFESGQFGQVTGLDRDYVEILAYSDKNILPEVRVARTFDRLGLEISTNLLGSVIDAFGHSLYHTSPVKNTGDKYTIEKESVGIANRKKITEPFLTGVSIVDLMVPLGKGQRELVIGDRQTGKTSFVLQTILNQVQTGAVCVYACIGKRKNDIKHVENFFKVHDLMRNSVIITSSANDPLGYIYSTPYSAMTIAEYLKDTGRDVLLILDDMTNHARFYREVSLLLKRFPGRDSYPGDIFYTHSRLLERAGSFDNGSITCLPIVSTVEGDISGYVQTNLMSMTDGHIFFDRNLFDKGQRPAINHALSVTRVGRQTQTSLRWSVNRELSSFFTLYTRTENFIHFGAEVSEGIRSTLDLGAKVLAFFNQPPGSIYSIELQILFICILWSGKWGSKKIDAIDTSVRAVVTNYENTEQFRTDFVNLVNTSPTLNALLGNFLKQYTKFEQYI